jgi:bifunctional UDP-N-acetylglucosamine pyrophosphorylase/glucosamine-1-phosphate N-acetyltransferase
LTPNNAQGELYLTDIIAMAVDSGKSVSAIQADAAIEVVGVNDKVQLAQLERDYQVAHARQLMEQGLTLIDPSRFDCRGRLQIGADCLVDVNCVFEGDVRLGDDVRVGSNCVIKNSRIGTGVRIEANSVIEDAVIDAGAQVGPFARIRPGTHLMTNAKVGNFVEVKKSVIGEGSKVSHLSYIGDTLMGKDVNIGAGTITCNYDGVNKFQTQIGDGAFIGSDSQLVAPVTIGEGATIGAGSTITKDTPAQQLTLSRSKQMTIANWQKPTQKS